MGESVGGRDSFGDNVSMAVDRSFKSLDQKLNDYEPVEDYVFIPVSETDPWYTSDYIETFHTTGGELFVKRGDGSQPTNAAETYVGPYYRWVREPQYSDNRKHTFGRMGDIVIGESYYGVNQQGKPKNKGLTNNAILQGLEGILREDIGGPMFVGAATPDADLNPKPISEAELKVAAEAGIHLNKSGTTSDALANAVIIKNTGDDKFIHITDLVSIDDAHSVLNRPGTDMSELAPTAKRFGLKGRPPVITNQPNAKIDFGNEPLG